MNFFLNYDSLRKDGLAFIPADTQVFPFLSVRTETETISSWVFTGTGRCAFGEWFHLTLIADMADRSDNEGHWRKIQLCFVEGSSWKRQYGKFQKGS